LKEQWYVLIQKKWTAAILCGVGGALTVAPLLLFPAIGRVPLLGLMFGNNIVAPAVLAAVLFACGLFFVVSVFTKTPGISFLVLFTYLVVLGFVYHSLYMPALDKSSKSVRLITDRMRDMPETTPVYTFGFSSPALIFYVGRPVRPVSNPADVLSEKGAIILVAENKRGRADALKALFPHSGEACYENESYLILARKDGE
jgi:hypothetical protein